MTSQLVLQREDTYDPGRTVAFGIWSGTYCGCVLHLIYNRFFPKVFPITTAAGAAHPLRRRHIVAMVCFDNFLSSPWFFMPSYYILREALRSAGTERGPALVVRTALETYHQEFWSCMGEAPPTRHGNRTWRAARAELTRERRVPRLAGLTWGMWVPIHFVTFGGIIPQHLRVHFTAVCSFFTLMMSSKLQGWLEKQRPRERLSSAACAARQPQATLVAHRTPEAAVR